MDTIPPQFVEIVEAVRELYVTQFADTVAGFSEETHVVEPVLLDSEGDIATEGPMRLPFRADYASLESGKLESFTARGIMPVVSIKGRDEVRLASFRALSGDELRGPWSGVAPPEPSPPRPPAPDSPPPDSTDVDADLDDLLAGFDDAADAGDDDGDIDADLAALLDDL